MKLEEAIAWLNNLFFDFKELGNVYTLTEEDLDAAHTLISHAEATRWRKLSEEKPPERLEMFQARLAHFDGTFGSVHLYWHDRDGRWSFGESWPNVTHWRPIVGPEDTDE